MRNRYITGYKNPELNQEIIEKCKLSPYFSTYRILKHFYHVDTYIDETKARLQGYVYPEDLYSEDVMSIVIPECEVAYMDDRLILFFTTRYEIKECPNEADYWDGDESDKINY